MDKDKPISENPGELETQFILRLPEDPAKTLKEILRTGDDLENRLTIQVCDDMRHGQVIFDQWNMHAKILDLPTTMESLKTVDKKRFYKTADICQIMICTEGEPPVQLTAEEESAKSKKKDSCKVDKKFLYPNGVTPPTKNIRKRRFRKTLKKKSADRLEIEEEVKRLLRSDNGAESITWEIINEDELSNINLISDSDELESVTEVQSSSIVTPKLSTEMFTKSTDMPITPMAIPSTSTGLPTTHMGIPQKSRSTTKPNMSGDLIDMNVPGTSMDITKLTIPLQFQKEKKSKKDQYHDLTLYRDSSKVEDIFGGTLSDSDFEDGYIQPNSGDPTSYLSFDTCLTDPISTLELPEVPADRYSPILEFVPDMFQTTRNIEQPDLLESSSAMDLSALSRILKIDGMSSEEEA